MMSLMDTQLYLLYWMRDPMEVISIFYRIVAFIEKVFLYDELELDVLDVNQMVSINSLGIVYFLDVFEVFIIESSKEIQLVNILELLGHLAYVDDVFKDVVGPTMVESDLLGS